MVLTYIPVFIDSITKVEVLQDCEEQGTEVTFDKSTNLMILLIVMLDNLCGNSR